MPRCFMAKKLKYPYQQWKDQQEDGNIDLEENKGDDERHTDRNEEEEEDFYLKKTTKHGNNECNIAKQVLNLKKGRKILCLRCIVPPSILY